MVFTAGCGITSTTRSLNRGCRRATPRTTPTFSSTGGPACPTGSRYRRASGRWRRRGGRPARPPPWRRLPRPRPARPLRNEPRALPRLVFYPTWWETWRQPFFLYSFWTEPLQGVRNVLNSGLFGNSRVVDPDPHPDQEGKMTHKNRKG